MQDCKPSNTPMEAKLILQPHCDSENDLTNAPFRQLVGSVMYLMLCTQPDLSYAISVLSKFLSMPTDEHWKSAKRILRYLQATPGKNLVFHCANELPIMAYCDANRASSNDRKSTSGYAIYVGSNLVSWSSKRQSVVALSSTEAEIIAATETMREILWIRNVLSSFGFTVDTLTLYCDSQPAIAIAHTGGYNGRSKHMDVKYRFLSDCVTNHNI